MHSGPSHPADSAQATPRDDEAAALKTQRSALKTHDSRLSSPRSTTSAASIVL
ncbi:MAG: hypothetical protein RLZZ387_3465 [Chloroflexota bacterium]|jgi:hypothetical protein